MSYITITTEYGRQNASIDIKRFAADLAKELGGQLLDAGNFDQQAIKVGADVLHLSANTWKRVVHAWISAPDVPHGDWSSYDKEQKAVDANVNPDGRSIAAIAKDLKRRVIDANQPALAKRRAHAAQQKHNRQNVAQYAADLKAAVPGLDIRVDERNQSAAIYSGPQSYYLSGRMGCDGQVSIDRIGSVSLTTFQKICAVLDGDKRASDDR